MMKPLTLVFVVVLVGKAVSAFPMLEITDSTFDFGMVASGITVEHGFWLFSTGDDTLRIVDVKTGCGCVTVPMEQQWLAPGDSLYARLMWRTRQSSEEMEQTAYIFTNADVDPFRITLFSRTFSPEDSTQPILVEQYGVMFPATSRESSITRSFWIRNNTDEELTITVNSYQDDKYELTMDSTIEAGGRFRGIIRVNTDHSESEFERSFTLEFNGRRLKAHRLTIPVAVGDFSFRPNLTTITQNKHE